jgi:DNA-binding MarR family transcriptional regulator
MSSSGPTLGWSIGVIFRAWQSSVAALLDHVPHGGRGYQILASLGSSDVAPTQAALAAHLSIDRTVLTYVLDDLVTAGLLERRTDAADRRVRRISLTDSGRGCLAELEEQVTAAESQLFPGLGIEERDALRALLGKAAVGIHAGSDPEHVCTVVADVLDSASAGVPAVS